MTYTHDTRPANDWLPRSYDTPAGRIRAGEVGQAETIILEQRWQGFVDQFDDPADRSLLEAWRTAAALDGGDPLYRLVLAVEVLAQHSDGGRVPVAQVDAMVADMTTPSAR